MEENPKKLLLEFNNISKKEWILDLSKAPNSIGLTFEKEINKKYDTDIFPDTII